jgi:hypothetical protein
MIQTGLSWAIPVDIVTLGSHLEAYMDIKLQVHAFRVCSRFGKGPEVFVNKIPHELIDIIINHLVQPVRLQYFESWMKLHNCFQGSCEPFEHECFHDLDVIDDVCTCERDSDWGESGWEECKCYESDEFFDLSMENYDPFEECIPNQMKWRNLVQQPSTGLVENVPRANVEKYGFAKYDEVGQFSSKIRRPCVLMIS